MLHQFNDEVGSSLVLSRGGLGVPSAHALVETYSSICIAYSKERKFYWKIPNPNRKIALADLRCTMDSSMAYHAWPMVALNTIPYKADSFLHNTIHLLT
jgi:hypothetical protein